MPEAPTSSSVEWEKAILSLLSSSEPKQVKKVRKQVLLSLQLEDDDKTSKKQFKKTVQGLEATRTIKLDADGSISLIEKQKKKKSKKEKKSKKRKLDDGDDDAEDNVDESDSKKDKKEKKSKKEKKKSKSESDNNDENLESTVDESPANETTSTATNENKNKPCKGNPQGCTRLFLGNLPFAVDETSLAAFLPGQVTHIKWITDKETGKFYGSAFCEMDNSISAADAVAMAGESLIGRPIKINFAPAREGDVWPPKDKIISGNGSSNSNNKNNGGQAGGSGVKAMSAKPEGCVKLFCGNLSYEIDDEQITKFFASVDAELKAVRWIHHRDSGDFKGVGFVEFWNTEACEKAASLNGKNLLGRPIRIDWTD